MLPQFGLGAILALGALLAGCSGSPPTVLSSDEQMTIYSLDPSSIKGSMRWDEKKHTGERFRGYTLFGKLDVSDAAQRRELALALNGGLAKGDAMAKCFEPRHGIRATKGNVVRDFVICFECSQVVLHTGEKAERKAIARDPEPVLNKILTNAGIRIAPELYEKK